LQGNFRSKHATLTIDPVDIVEYTASHGVDFLNDCRYIRLKDLAEEIGICQRTIRDWIKRGLICYRPSRRLVLIKRTDLDEFLSKYKDDQNQIDELVDQIVEDVV